MTPATKVTLQILRQSEDEIRVTPFRDVSVLESTVKTSRICKFHSSMVAERARDILGILARANGGVPDLLPALEEAGRAIWVDLLPPFLKERLAEARGADLLLHLDEALVGIPWELLHDGEEFLGRGHRMGRLVTLDGQSVAMQRSMDPPLSVLIVADPSGDLPAARAELEELVTLLEDAAHFGSTTIMAGDVSTRAFRDALGSHDVLHFAGHAVGGGGEGAGLRFSDGLFSTALMRELGDRVDFPGLVFLNACGSSDDAIRLSARTAETSFAGVSGIASSLLRSGVRHFVGTLWEIRDEVARTFALAFYGRLGAGESIGRAMGAGQAAVIEAFGEDTLLWADHLLYGDPSWTIAPPDNRIDDDFAVLDGIEQRYRSELLSHDPAERLMAAAMLLRLGDRSVLAAVGRDLDELERWMTPDAPEALRRRAGLVIQALAAAAGMRIDALPEELPSGEQVRALHARLLAQGSGE